MNVLFEINHPANVLLFKEVAYKLKANNHNVIFTARNKEVTNVLLEQNKLNYISFGSNYSSLVGKVVGLIKFSFQTFKVSKVNNIDLFVSHNSIYASIVSLICNKPHICFNAVENDIWVKLNWLLHNSVNLTSYSFSKKFSNKQIYYNGFHELTYLHPKYFKPNSDVIKQLNLMDDEPFILVRFVKWDAYDEIGKQGLSDSEKIRVIEEFEKKMKVFISSQGELPEELIKYKLNVAPSDFQSVEYYATLIWGESGSMAAECAMLGTPSYYVSNKKLGFLEMLQNKYKMVFICENINEALDKALKLLDNTDLSEEFYKRKKEMYEDLIDTASFFSWFIEQYPKSKEIMLSNPKYQFEFK